jgi:hypothetical protein
MPRGNDSAELAGSNYMRFGEHLNADELIRANAATFDPALQKVLATATDEEATAEVLESLEEYAGKFDLAEGETLISAAVHGHALVGVIEKPDGRHRKAIAPFSDRFKLPTLSPAEEEQRERAKVAESTAAETARVREESERRLAEAREEVARYEAEQMAKIEEEREASAQRLREAREQAEADAAEEAEAAEGEKAAEKPEGDDAKTAGAKPASKRSSGAARHAAEQGK